MEILSPPLPPRTYELRDDPIKTIGASALCIGLALVCFCSDEFWLKLSGWFFAVGGVIIFLNMGDVRALLATPDGLKIRRGFGWYFIIPWADVTEITVFDYGKYGGPMGWVGKYAEPMVWIRVSESSASYKAWPKYLRLITGRIGLPTDGYFVISIGNKPAEVVEELKELYAEYVRDGVIKPGKLSATLSASAPA